MAGPDLQPGPEPGPEPAPEPAPEPGREPEARAPRRQPLPVYVPEGYVLRRRSVPVAAPTPARAAVGRPGVLLAVSFTLVLGVLVGYLAGFAVARRDSDTVVDVTVHTSPAGR